MSGEPYQPPQESGGGSVIKIVMIVLGVLVAGCVCCVAAIAAMVYWSASAIDAKAYEELKDVPAVVQEFGTLEEGDVSWDIWKTAEFAQKFEEQGGQNLVLSVDGSDAMLVVAVEGDQMRLVGIWKGDEFIETDGQLPEVSEPELESGE